MKRFTVILVLMLLLISCSNKTQLSVAHYKNEDVEIEILSNKEMGVVYKFEKLGFGGQGHYDYVSDGIYTLEVGDIYQTYYVVEDRGMLILINQQYTVEEIKEGDYTPTYLLYEVTE